MGRRGSQGIDSAINPFYCLCRTRSLGSCRGMPAPTSSAGQQDKETKMETVSTPRRSLALTSLVAALLTSAVCGGAAMAAGVAASDNGGLLKLSVLSSRPELVSGGDALV